MRKVPTFLFVFSGLLTLAGVTTVRAAAQDLRTIKEMEEFVAKASTPAEHSQLAKHFLEMAAKYKADADTHTAMAAKYRSYPAPLRRTGGDPGAHCDHLAHQGREAATTASELAKYHDRLATEGPNSGAQPPTTRTLKMPEVRYPDLLSDKEAQELVASAKMPADHAKLGKHFAAKAASYTADAQRHAAFAAGYRSNTRSSTAFAADHCDRLVKQTREAASAARELSTYHQSLGADTTK